MLVGFSVGSVAVGAMLFNDKRSLSFASKISFSVGVYRLVSSRPVKSSPFGVEKAAAAGLAEGDGLDSI
jgi:hypothetical protein